MKKINKFWLFLLFTFGISYSLAGLFVAFGGEYSSTGGMVMAIAFMFTPALSVFIVEKLVHHEKISRRLLISFKINRWFIVAWLLPPLLAFLTFAVSLMFPGVYYSPEMEGMFARYENLLTPEQMEDMHQSIEAMPLPPVLMLLIQGLLAGITLNAVAGFGEELGWRGFLTRQFEKMKFWKAALITGLIWGIWHAPVILMGHNYPQHPVAGVFMMTVWCILLSPVFLFIKAQSVIAASVLHGTINATGAISIILISGGNDLLIGITGLAGFIALAFLIGFFAIYDRYISREKIMLGMIGNFLPALEEHKKNI
jgi:uncharacterized protein